MSPGILPLGTLFLDLFSLQAIGPGALDASGRAEFALVLPPDPGFPVPTFYIQAIVAGAIPRFTGFQALELLRL